MSFGEGLFEPGDRVESTSGRQGTVHSVYETEVNPRCCLLKEAHGHKPHVHYNERGDSWDYINDLKILEKGNGAAQSGPETTNKLNKEPQDMSAIDTIKSAKLDQTTRALRADGLEEDNGNVTSYGLALMNQKNWEANRVAYAKELIAAKKTLANEQLAYNKSVSADEDDE